MTAGREPFQACTEGNDKGGVGGGEEEAKKATFYWCQRQKKSRWKSTRPAYLGCPGLIWVGVLFLDSAESVSVCVMFDSIMHSCAEDIPKERVCV